MSDRINWYGAYDFTDGRCLIWNESVCNAELTTHFVAHLADWLGDIALPIVIIWNSAPCHRAQLVQTMAAQLGFQLVLPPGYGPDFNAIEGLWKTSTRFNSARAFGPNLNWTRNTKNSRFQNNLTLATSERTHGVKYVSKTRDEGPGHLAQIRDRILDVALDIFSRKGYRDTHLDEVATQADTSEGILYFHFASKEQLFLALIDQFANLLERRVTVAISQHEQGVARVRAALEVCLETFGHYRWPAKLLLIQAVGLGNVFEEKRMEIHERFAELIETYLQEAIELDQIKQVDTEVTAHAWMGAIYNLVIRWLQTGEPEQERIAATLPPMLLRSVGYEDAQ